MKTRFLASLNSNKGKLKPMTYVQNASKRKLIKRKGIDHGRTDIASGDLDIILFFHLRISLCDLSPLIQNSGDKWQNPKPT